MKKTSVKNDLPIYLFHDGTNYRSYEFFGVHRIKGTYYFRVWAPNAENVILISDFTSWDDGVEMKRLNDEGIWEIKINPKDCIYNNQGSLENLRYKYRISSKNGKICDKADPFAFYSETLGKTASIVYTNNAFKFSDRSWNEKRSKILNADGRFYSAPLNIYEIHLGSWMTRDGNSNEDGESYLNYREIADLLVPYVKKMGYTHVELMPVAEHPFDGSWGYQVCGYYAPTSRFGNPDDFRYFINKLHRNNIGVILDWVPAHFPKDAHGLYEFDGEYLYEYSDPLKMEHKSWGTRCFDVGRKEVKSFLISNAVYWFDKFNIDGLRVDAVASMLYLDYDRKDGEWRPNQYGGNQNIEAIDFFRQLNTVIKEQYPDRLVIAEESTAWGGVTSDPKDGGLGFTMKWNMGWSNDMFVYIAQDPFFRKGCHDKLTFPMMYAYSEKFILPVSHDEVVHGKCSLINKMFGSYESKFEQMRTFLTFQMTYPGKKLTFMGCEFGQFREWDYKNQLEWFMLDYPNHKNLQNFTASLNKFYMNNPSLFDDDYSWSGFNWIYADMADRNLIAYNRFDKNGERLTVIINFSGETCKDLYIPTPDGCTEYKNVFDTDNKKIGGNGSYKTRYKISKRKNKKQNDGVPGVYVDVAPFSAIILKPVIK